MSGITVQLDTMPAPVMAAHCRGLFEAIGSFFDDPDNQAKFEAWHRRNTAAYRKKLHTAGRRKRKERKQ